VLRDVLSQGEKPSLDIGTAFMNLKACEALEPEIFRVQKLRLLLGKEQGQEAVIGEKLLKELENATASGETSAAQIKRWQEFFEKDHVVVRLYSEGFLHGKAYIVTGVPNLGAIGIVGSSNFTHAGLTTNRELNAVLKQSSAVRELQEWFEQVFSKSKDYKKELLEILTRFTREYSPYQIYIKVLYEALKDRLSADLGEEYAKPSPIALADFQRDGYLAAKEILEANNGVLIADSVGLGKTFLALRLLDDYAYKERQTALVICPAAIRDTIWRPYLEEHAIPSKVVSMEEVSREDFPVEEYVDYKVIVVDESHNFRNPETNRWQNLFEIASSKPNEKKIILLTATPVNNTAWDLFHQLRLLTKDDDRFLLVAGIESLEKYFRKAEEKRDVLYEVLEALAVRRSRQFIRKNYPGAKIDGKEIRFPERKIQTIRYSLKDTYGAQLYTKVATMIEGLNLAPYQIDCYRKRKEQDQELWMTLGRQQALASIMRVLYLKRLESSVEALRISLSRLQNFLRYFIRALEDGRLLSAKTYRKWLQTEGNDEEGAEENADFSRFVENLEAIPKDLYDIEAIRHKVNEDLSALEGVLKELEEQRKDKKLETLERLLVSKELEGHKIIVFSYFKDTARYLYRHLTKTSSLQGERIDIVDSSVHPEDRRRKIEHFSPKANKKDLMPEDEIRILISTDVLSEGQNLQDADVVINYDLHWNPVRMVQRVGRLDRLGSPHSVIHVANFFPEEELEDLLGLLKRLTQKIDEINQTVGLDASVLGEVPNPKEFNILRKLEQEDATVLEELERENELAIGEFLKQDLLGFLKEVGEKSLKDMPLGVGTVRKDPEARKGFFASFRDAKRGQHYWLFYDEEKGRIVEQRLEAISHIRCDQSEHALPYPQGFDAKKLIEKLKRHLFDRLREAELRAPTLKQPQRDIVNWLSALPETMERNTLLKYFQQRPITGQALKELRKVWQDRGIPTEKMLQKLAEFQKTHPMLETSASYTPNPPLDEEDLKCIAWMKIC
jgi:ERCC4-related helicase